MDMVSKKSLILSYIGLLFLIIDVICIMLYLSCSLVFTFLSLTLAAYALLAITDFPCFQALFGRRKRKSAYSTCTHIIWMNRIGYAMAFLLIIRIFFP